MSMMNVVDRFLWARAKHADRVAIEGELRAWTYAQLDADSARVCGYLLSRGIGKGDVVPILMQRSPQFVVAALGVIRSGAAFAPIDLSSPLARQAQILASLSARAVLHDDAGATVTDAHPHAAHVEQALRSDPRTPEPKTIHCDDPLYVMYTSGSTGAPKGVVVPHRGVVRLVVDADWAEFDPSQRWLLNSSIAFDASTLEIWGPLLNGATCVVQEKPLISFDELARFFVDKRITESWLTSSLFNAMVDMHVESFRNVRQLCTGGERESPQHMRAFVAALPHVHLIHGYGPTENTVFSHTHHVTLADTAPGRRVPIGRPIRGTTDRIERSDGSLAAIGEPGELIVGGLGVGLGYLNDRDLTARKFIVRSGEVWYRTGDQVVRRSDGAVEFIGRLDRQVKIQGNRIELDEIESVMRSCPDVGDVYVFVDGDSAESKRLVACFTGRTGQNDGVERVREFLQERLPRIMVPRVLRRLDRFPLKISGKVDEAVLSELLASKPVSTETDQANHSDPEGGVLTPTEHALASLWRKRLPGLPIGRHDSLLGLGGHSLLAMRLAADIARELRCNVSPARLLDAESLADIAKYIDCVRLESKQSSTDTRSREAVTSVGIQQRLLAASSLSSSGDAYIVPVAFTLPASQPLAPLRDAFRTLITRHEMLRLASGSDGDGDPTILPEPPEGWWTAHANPTHVPSDSWPEALLQRIFRPLDPASQGPTRIDVWPVAEGGWLVVWTTHHAVIDEWSIRLILDQLVGLLGGQTITAVADAKTFLAQEVELADAEKARGQAADIAKILDSEPIPFSNWSRPAVEIELPIDRAHEQAITSIAQQAGTTPVAPALAAYGIAIQEVVGDAWRFVTTPIAKRHSPELIDAVNCCLEMRIIECGAREGESTTELVRRVHTDLVSCQDRSFVPFDVITSELRRRRPDLAAAPVQFGFTWRRDPYPVIPLLDPDSRSNERAGELRVLRVPQRTTVFGCTLHIEEMQGRLRARLEVCEDCVASGIAQRLVRAFRESIVQLAASAAERLGATTTCERTTPLPKLVTPVAPQAFHAGETAPASTVLAGIVSECWKEVLGKAPENEHTDFFDAGGTSFSLLRLVAILRQKTGSTIDGGKALAESTFGDICNNVLDSKLKDRRTWIQLGDIAAKHTLLMLPGNAGYALGMCRLVEKICAVSPVPMRCIVVNLVDVWRTVGRPHRVEQVVDQVIATLAEAGVEHPWGIMGFSIGGPLAIAVEQRLASMGRPTSRLWIIDGYAPILLRHDLHIRVVRKVATMARRAWDRVRGVQPPPQRAETGEERNSDWLICGVMHGATEEIDREAYQQQLGLMQLGYCDADVVLLRSAIMGRKVNIISRGATNGFNPAMFRSIRVESAEYSHLELIKEHADWTAGIIVRTLGVQSTVGEARSAGVNLLLPAHGHACIENAK